MKLLRFAAWTFLLSLVLLSVSAAAAEDADAAPTCKGASVAWLTADAVALPAGYQTTTFCDSTPDHGSSKSCKEEGRATGAVSCPARQRVANLNCNPGQACVGANGQPGNWCDCKWQCLAIAEPEPTEPIGSDR